jgi:N utilization substance protein A
MSNINLIDSFQEFKDFKNIDRPTMMSVLEDVFRSMIRKKYGNDENCDVIVNTDNGDLEIWRTRKVMEDGFSEDDDLEIELAEAKTLIRIWKWAMSTLSRSRWKALAAVPY